MVDNAYVNQIRARVKSNMILLADIKGNPEAIFEVIQLPDGTVMDVKLRKSSGAPVLDDAVERAIRKSSPLPLPANRAQFQRQLEFKYRPLD